MKPRRPQKHVKATLQEKVVIGHKSMPNQTKPTTPASHQTQVKPFAGKVFYLDLPSNRKADALENDIKQLGGTVEKFFSKEIKYLVSNKREAKYVQCLRHDSPVPSPDSGHGSPRSHPPEGHRDGLKATTPGQTGTAVPSRGKSLVERVVKEQERIQMNKILSNALEWGVKILYIDDVIAYVEKKKRNVTPTQCNVTTTAAKKSAKAESTGRPAFQKYKGGRIIKPFVKVEDSSRQYRPIYLAMPHMPEFSLLTAPPCSPFYVDDKDVSGRKPREHKNRGPRGSASEDRGTPARLRRNKEKKRGGFCECCALKYDNLRTHLQSERHQAFSRSEQYLVVDRLVSTLHCNLLHMQRKRRKCTISSILLAPVPYRTTEDDDGGAKETEEGRRAAGRVERPAELKHRIAPAAAPIGHREGGGPDNKPLVKRRPLPRKRVVGGSLRAPSRRAELVQMPRLVVEAPPSRGESSSSSSTSDPAIAWRHAPAHQDTRGPPPHPPAHPHPPHPPPLDGHGSTWHGHRQDLHEQFPSKSVASSRRERPAQVELRGSPSAACVQGGNASAEDVPGVPENVPGVPENEAGDSNAHGRSPARTIQRRLRVFKRKRRKVDSRPSAAERGESSDVHEVHDDSMLRLWRIFQSSDDMDVEFLGFED